MSDPLARIEPVARDLIRRVDAALIAHGAPANHEIWGLLRRLGLAPGEAIDFFLTLQSGPLLAAGAALREQVEAYAQTPIPSRIAWAGAAGEAYVPVAAAVEAHLGSADEDDPSTMVGRLRETASYVESVAEWMRQSRGAIAEALADVLTSSQALTVHSTTALSGNLADLTSLAGRLSASAVAAAADIGAHLLAAAVSAQEAGHNLATDWSGRLAELQYHSPISSEAYQPGAAVELRQ